ncbi:hypothetical protein M902_0986 [Bacteriovorax sp. BAL6_X]|uniref:hypothetical protein n=1 Tax=Bacteriovorax sp. BAL6_X TaxID=1201290 RepID=UPI00038679DA|nr:hypothetical protein [Bacteriovorax sp. BAL6_X]EPZ49753.1 hypothetical protein M902_0986 [Bacteriovorax sp. BAL6_X]
MLDFIFIFLLLYFLLSHIKIKERRGFYILFILCYLILKPIAWGVLVKDDYKVKNKYLFDLSSESLERADWFARNATLLFPLWGVVYFIKSKIAESKKYPYLSDAPYFLKDLSKRCFDINESYSLQNGACRQLLEALYNIKNNDAFSRDFIKAIWDINIKKNSRFSVSNFELWSGRMRDSSRYSIKIPLKCGIPEEVYLYFSLLNSGQPVQDMLSYYNSMFANGACSGFSYSYHLTLRRAIQSGYFYNVEDHNDDIILYAYDNPYISRALSSLYTSDLNYERKRPTYFTRLSKYYRITACKYRPKYNFKDIEENCRKYFGYTE